MRIDISSKPEFNNVFLRDLKRARSKTCPLSPSEDFTRFQGIADHAGENYKLRYHAASTLMAHQMGARTHKTLSTAVSDTHNEIEKLGFQTYFDKYCVLLTLDNRMDLVFNLCCGADPENVRKIPNYEFVSFSILNVCSRPEDNICLRAFKGHDLMLDKYIESCFTKDCEEDLTEEDVLVRFYSGILDASATILTTIAMNIYKTLHLSLRSQGFSNFVFGALAEKYEVPEFIECSMNGLEFELPLYVLRRGQYLDMMKEGRIL